MSAVDVGLARLDAHPVGRALRRIGPGPRLVLAVTALAMIVIGTLLPWASFPGFPGKMTLTAYPAGAKLYCLLLAAGTLLAVAPVPGRRSAGLALMTAEAAVAIQTTVAIAQAGGSASTIDLGAILAIAGGLVGMLSFLAGPDEKPPPNWQLPAWAGISLMVLVAAGGLELFVYSLDVEAASQFVGELLAMAGIAVAASRVGLVGAARGASADRRPLSYVLLALAAVAFPLAIGGNSHWLDVGAEVGAFAAAAVGLNVVVGLAGLLDLGYIAFFGAGAYVAAEFSGATLGPSHGHLPFVLVIVLGALVAGALGVAIGAPTLRLRGDYLAIVTLGFGEIFNQVVNNSGGKSGTAGLTGGPQGVGNIPNLKIGGLDWGSTHNVLGTTISYFGNYFILELLLVGGVMAAFYRLSESRVGRAWVAIREDELAASAMGINTTALKLLAFGIGATVAGAAGTFNAHVATSVTPDAYVFSTGSVLLLAAVVLGGMGSVGGAVLGSALLFFIPEKLRDFNEYRELLFGVALIVLMRFRPEGLLANRRRAREFRETAGPDALSAPPRADAPI